jgi:two-component system CheB/CheR fusion protein
MLNLSVTPLGDKPSKGKGTRGRHFFLILFEDVTPLAVPAAEAARGNKSKSRNQSDQDARRLERELASAREALRSAIEAEDSFKEEFQSANEEILSANEELQSTNEELETSKEELQSANEELSTLNAELRNKNSELHDLSNDILNLLNSTRIPVVMLDRRLYIRRITPAATKLFKVVPADIGRPFADIKLNIEESDITSHDLELQITKVLDSLLPSEREVRDLEGCWHSLSILPYRTQENKIDGVVLALKDIHAVKSANELLMKSDQVLRASEERFRTLFNMGPVAVYYCDVNGSIQNYNQRAVELWGRAPDDGVTDQQFRGIFKLFRPDGSILPLEQSPMAEVLSGKVQEVRDQEVIMERPDGSRIVVVVNILRLESSDGEITGAINCFYDISERKLTEAAMMKSEKLAAAGRLAATLAHEINNPLQAVANLVTIWAQTPGLDAQGRTYANMAESELRRVSHLTQQSLSFYRETSAPAPVNVEETIDTVLAIYEKRIEAKRIQVKKRYRSDGAMIRTFPGELRQVISTLLLNATEAIDENGTITVRVRNASHVQNPAIRGVRITFADSGVGISESNLPRIFEPFYTTKGEKGTGLGLWVASGIVDRSGGSIQTRSNACPDKHGTCFSIFLPAKP